MATVQEPNPMVLYWDEKLLVMPADLGTLEKFRAWAQSDAFPDNGRIDFLNGSLEIDMSPESVMPLGTLKSIIAAGVTNRSQEIGGYVMIDRSRISSPDADLSVEPDVVYISEDSVRNGRVELLRGQSKTHEAYTEIEGGPDLIVEIVSDSSVTKDNKRLPPLYFQAGVREYWVADARKDLTFSILRRGKTNFEPVSSDADGFTQSDVLGLAFKLTRERDSLGYWKFCLLSK